MLLWLSYGVFGGAVVPFVGLIGVWFGCIVRLLFGEFVLVEFVEV